MPRVSPSTPEDATPPSLSGEAEVSASTPDAPAQRPLPPNPGIGGSYILDPVEWVWVLQTEE